MKGTIVMLAVAISAAILAAPAAQAQRPTEGRRLGSHQLIRENVQSGHRPDPRR